MVNTRSAGPTTTDSSTGPTVGAEDLGESSQQFVSETQFMNPDIALDLDDDYVQVQHLEGADPQQIAWRLSISTGY